jgi:SulP family sulfate permease
MGVFANLSNFLSIVIGSFIARGIIASGGFIQVVGEVPSGLRSPQLNLVSLPQWISMIPASCAIAFVSFAGNWAVAVKYAQINKYRVEATQELIASGLAIVVGVFFNSFVVSGGLARTAVNAESGATTQMSMCICATLILLSLLALTSFFYFIPMCVLSAVIEVSVISMIDFESMIKAYKVDKRDCLVMVTTFLITFFLGITEGLFAGIFLSVAVVMKTTAFPHIVHIGKLPETEGGYYRDIRRYPQAEQIPGYAIIRMDASPLFSNCSHFKDVVVDAAHGKYHSHHETIHTVIIDASAWIDMDLIGVQTLLEIKEELNKDNVHIAVACAKGIIRDRLRDSNFTIGMERNCFYFSIDDALHGRAMAGQSLILNSDYVEQLNSYQQQSEIHRNAALRNKANHVGETYSILHTSPDFSGEITADEDAPPSF